MLNNRPTKQQINHLHNRPTKGETNWPTYGLTDRQTDRLIKDHTRRQTDQQTDGRLKRTVRQIDRQTLSNGQTQNLFNYLSFSWTFILLQSGGNCKDKKISSINLFSITNELKPYVNKRPEECLSQNPVKTYQLWENDLFIPFWFICVLLNSCSGLQNKQ